MTSRVALQRMQCLFLAALALVKARLQIVHSSEGELARNLVTPSEQCANGSFPERSDAWLRDFSWALCGLANRAPFRTDCLVRMLAAKHVLQNRVSFEVHLQAAVANDSITAHTWVSARGIDITGGPVAGLHALSSNERSEG